MPALLQIVGSDPQVACPDPASPRHRAAPEGFASSIITMHHFGLTRSLLVPVRPYHRRIAPG